MTTPVVGPLTLFDLQPVTDRRFENPCVRLFGPGPKGAICKGCVHLYVNQPGHKNFFKCDLRRHSNGPATDHKARWPACARFEARPTKNTKGTK